MRRIAFDIKKLIESGQQLAIIHGGGKDVDLALAKAGIETKKVDGLRVTCKETLQIVSEVLRRKNRELVKALSDEGVQAIGLQSGVALYVTPKMPVFTRNGIVHLGFVGSVIGHSEHGVAHLKSLISSGTVPVIHPVYISGNVCLNVNADEVCGAVAGALKAERVIYLSDVSGICSCDGDVLREIRVNRMALIRNIVHGGMVPKISSCMTALDMGAKETLITNTLSQGNSGTKIVR
jgi:acetylglutamate kinase